MVPRYSLVNGECAHAEFGRCLNVVQVGVEASRPAAVQGRLLVVRTRRGLFLEFRNADNFHACLRADVESGVEIRVKLVENRLVVVENLLSPFVAVFVIEFRARRVFFHRR